MIKIFVKLLIFLFIIIISITIYKNHYGKNISQYESYNYYHTINALKNNDNTSAKFHAKKILKKETYNIYYDMAIYILYKIAYNEHNNKKMSYYKKKIINNKKSIIKKIIN